MTTEIPSPEVQDIPERTVQRMNETLHTALFLEALLNQPERDEEIKPPEHLGAEGISLQLALMSIKRDVRTANDTIAPLPKDQVSDAFYQKFARKDETEQPHSPRKHDIEIVDTCPVAVIAKLDPEDGKNTVLWRDPGLFYDQVSLEINGEQLHFPVILLAGKNQAEIQYVEDHEKRHARHAVLRTAIDRVKAYDQKTGNPQRSRLIDWGGTSSFAEVIETVQDLSAHPSEEAYNLVVGYALAELKEEMLVRFDPKFYQQLRRTSEIIIEKYRIVEDIFLTSHTEKDEVFDQVQMAYLQKVEQNIPAVSDIVHFYRCNPEWSGRFNTFQWVLSQFPVEHWDEQLTELGFKQEVALYQTFIERTNTLFSLASADSVWPSRMESDIPLPDDNKAISEEVSTEITKVIDALKQANSMSMIPRLQASLKALDAIEIKTQALFTTELATQVDHLKTVINQLPFESRQSIMLPFWEQLKINPYQGLELVEQAKKAAATHGSTEINS